MDLRCRLGFHKWIHNTSRLIEGTVRTCKRCDREEMYLSNIKYKWVKCLQGETINICGVCEDPNCKGKDVF